MPTLITSVIPHGTLPQTPKYDMPQPLLATKSIRKEIAKHWAGCGHPVAKGPTWGPTSQQMQSCKPRQETDLRNKRVSVWGLQFVPSKHWISSKCACKLDGCLLGRLAYFDDYFQVFGPGTRARDPKRRRVGPELGPCRPVANMWNTCESRTK